MTPLDIAWLAGLFEGEGCISITPKSVMLQIGMTDQDIMQRVDSLFPSTSGIRFVQPKDDNRKPMYIWTIRKHDYARQILLTLMPHFGERRKAKAEEALTFLASRPGGNKSKTQCPQGHDYDYVRPNGRGRGCRECVRKSGQRYYAKNHCTTEACEIK
jgi:hypothetical protein